MNSEYLFKNSSVHALNIVKTATAAFIILPSSNFRKENNKNRKMYVSLAVPSYIIIPAIVQSNENFNSLIEASH